MSATIPSCRTPDAARDRVVPLCGDVENLHVLDVGSGDGLIGRALLQNVGPTGSITFLDHDAAVIQKLADEFDHIHRARAVVDDARTLSTIEQESIDLVVMRAVLLYIPEKLEALTSARRVLRPHGRIVISEPVNRPLYYPATRMWGFDLAEIPIIASKLQGGFTEHASPETRAMNDWEDVDLVTMVSDAGFTEIRMETVTEVSQGAPIPWLAFLHAKWTPWLPSLASVLHQQLSDDEQRAFEQVVRPQLAAGRQRLLIRNTFLTALPS